ncbi:MAG: helix-turn-helix transcriptional regulator, partial [Bacteroidetes bacterium]|nr:helix-turn-helix transcriptional regulator [Fibrella sp.]
FVKKGGFRIDLATKGYEMHTGHVVVEKADYQYRLYPATGQCSIVNFSPTFYELLTAEYDLKNSFFFGNANLLSLLLTSSPTIDYLHYQIVSSTQTAAKLTIDNLVLELVQHILRLIENNVFANEVAPSLQKNHLTTVEKAKEYMQAHFSEDISLLELSNRCCVSPFHLCRIIKQFTAYSPHQYLMTLRLMHAERLLRNTSVPIVDVCFSSGFNSIEYFATVFKQHYNRNPTQYRKRAGY